MLSNHENQARMRCKLVENLKFDSHFEASRLRDYSGYSGNYSNTSASSSTLTEPTGPTTTTTTTATTTSTTTPATTNKSSAVIPALAQQLSINKQAINAQIKEDVVGDEEFAAVPSSPPPNQLQPPQQLPTGQQQSSGDQQQQQQQSQQQQTQNNQQVKENTSPASESGRSRTSSISTTATKQTLTGPIETPYQVDHFAHLEEKEKLLIKSDCELITVTRVIKGVYLIIDHRNFIW